MRFGDSEESSNIEDRRASGRFSGGRTIGLGTLVLVLVAWYFGIDPSALLNGTVSQQVPPTQTRSASASPQEEQTRHFVAQVLADTEQTWSDLFGSAGKTYREPHLVLFRGATQTACGTGNAATGPFYCPADEKVYIDLSFYDELRRRFKAPGDAAQAYVIAHEIGHHVQNLLGISAKVDRAREHLGQTRSNTLSVRLELQADCLAGVWFYHANQRRRILETGDIEEVLTAASAIGDDALQRQATGQVVPDSFTHGSSQQRMKWFSRGFETGVVKQCDTFGQ